MASVTTTISEKHIFKPRVHIYTLLELLVMLLKLVVKAIILIFVVYVTSWRRELKFKIEKWYKTKKDNMLLSPSSTVNIN